MPASLLISAALTGTRTALRSGALRYPVDSMKCGTSSVASWLCSRAQSTSSDGGLCATEPLRSIRVRLRRRHPRRLNRRNINPPDLHHRRERPLRRRQVRAADHRDQGPRCDLQRHPHRSLHHPHWLACLPEPQWRSPSSGRLRDPCASSRHSTACFADFRPRSLSCGVCALPGSWERVCHEQTRRRLVEPSIIKTSPPLVRDAHRTHG